MVTAQTAEPQ